MGQPTEEKRQGLFRQLPNIIGCIFKGLEVSFLPKNPIGDGGNTPPYLITEKSAVTPWLHSTRSSATDVGIIQHFLNLKRKWFHSKEAAGQCTNKWFTVSSWALIHYLFMSLHKQHLFGITTPLAFKLSTVKTLPHWTSQRLKEAFYGILDFQIRLAEYSWGLGTDKAWKKRIDVGYWIHRENLISDFRLNSEIGFILTPNTSSLQPRNKALSQTPSLNH